jgi:oxygen-dependent protoporphyrinogen oxidase
MGGVRDPEVVDKTDEEIRLQALESLKHVYGAAFRPQWIEIKRAKAAIPQQQRGHRRKVTAIRNSLLQLPGVELAGGYLDGISLENCATSGIDAANRILHNASQ